MVTFRSNNNNNNNNNRRPSFRSNNNRRPTFRRNEEGSKFSNNSNFHRNAPGRNNHNASKLIEKYNDLAREALTNEDRVLSESYFQHADHFTRILNEQEKERAAKVSTNSPEAVTSIKVEEKTNTIEKKKVENTAIKVKEKKLATS